MKKQAFFSLFFLMGFAVSLSEALPTLYQVECIVFTQADPDDATTDLTPISAPDFNKTITLTPANVENDLGTLSPFQELPPIFFKLQSQASKLSESGNRILWHKAWLQPLDAKTRVQINTQTENNWLVGILSLHNTHFLESHIHLLLLPARSNLSDGTRLSANLTDQLKQSDSIAILKQTEHFKLNTLVYFDHPKLGMLLKVMPFGQ